MFLKAMSQSMKMTEHFLYIYDEILRVKLLTLDFYFIKPEMSVRGFKRQVSRTLGGWIVLR